MNPADARRLAGARRQLPEMAQRHTSLEAVCAEFLRLHPDLIPVLGESLLRRWVRESLRRIKERRYDLGGQLPLFGQFGDAIRTRDEWTPDNYRDYFSRYANAAARNAAMLRVLATEFTERFGYAIDEAA